MRHSDSIAKLAPALVKAHAEVSNALKDSANPHYGSTFASLGSVLDAVKPVFAKHGLAILQMPAHVEDGMAGLESMIVHESGEWISETASAPTPVTYTKSGDPRPPDAQSVGSVITYLRRYSLAAIAQITQEDDDGNAASEGRRSEGARSQGQGHGHGQQSDAEPLTCPKCGTSEMWNNIGSKTNPKSPDLKCKDKDGCGHALWLDGWERDLLEEVKAAHSAGVIDADAKTKAEDQIVSRDPHRMMRIQERLNELAQGAAA